MDKRTKNNLYGVKSWVHVYSDSFGSFLDIRMKDLFEDRGRVVWGERGELSGYLMNIIDYTCNTFFQLSLFC